MKVLSLAPVFAILVSFLAVSHSRVIEDSLDEVQPHGILSDSLDEVQPHGILSDSLDEIQPYGILSDSLGEVQPYGVIDSVIRFILEKMKPQFADLKFDNISQSITTPDLKASVFVGNILIRDVDKFTIQNLKSNAVPLKLMNLTLTWASVTASASYDIDVTIRIPQSMTPLRLYAKGNARAVLKHLFLTAGANMDLKNQAIQIKPRGIFGFDVRIDEADVSLSSIMGSPDLGEVTGVFIGKIIPELVNTLKKPLFEAFQDEIIRILNEVLKKHPNFFMDEESMSLEESFEGLERDSLLKQPIWG